MTEFEHTEVEIDEGEETPAPSPPHDHHHPSAHDVIVAALAQRLPCQHCGSIEACACPVAEERARIEERATLIESALATFRYLPTPGDEPEPFNAEETAQWLAERSGFVRYTQVKDGWKRLLEAEADVELATIKAMTRVPTSEVDMVKAAKAALLSWHSAKAV